MTISLTGFQIASLVVGVIAGTIAIYKYLIKRPDLAFDAFPVGDLDEKDQAPVVFYVKNRGRRFAEDVFIEIYLIDWELETTVDEVAESMFPSRTEYTWKTFTSFGEDERHSIYLKNPIYENVELEVAARIIQFERGKRHRIQYLIACRSHRPRGGTIDIVVSKDGSVDIESEHSTLWKRIKNRQI